MSGPNILVIKLGALGDFVQAMGPFAAIRAHHPGAHITLLTTAPFAELAQASPYFDEVWLDDKPPLWRIDKVAALRRRLLGGQFTRVYDLQTSDRSSWYFRLIGWPGRAGGQSNIPEWSGIAKGCSHPHANPRRDDMHTIERQREQLAMAGIKAVPAPDLAWAEAAPGQFDLPVPFVLLVPGGAPHRPAKRWPVERFSALAGWLVERGITPVLLGTVKEKTEIEAIVTACPQAVDLSGRTGFPDIIALARRAEAALGNDTGPMHLIAAGGCPSVVLFSHESDPGLCAPRGNVTVLRRPTLAELGEAEVETALAGLLGHG